jgi:hypothetical protein
LPPKNQAIAAHTVFRASLQEIRHVVGILLDARAPSNKLAGTKGAAGFSVSLG